MRKYTLYHSACGILAPHNFDRQSIMLAKIIIIGVMAAILLSLIRGLFFLVRDKGQNNRTAKALTWRIGLSISLFLFLFLAFRFGWIHPHAM